MHVESPQVLAGRYRLLQRLGAGSTATTYVAEDLALGRRVAIKLFHPAALTDPADLARFEREARAAAAVTHPNVVRVYDAGVDKDRRFLVMEWVDGIDLKQFIRQRGRLPLEEAARIMSDLLQGLAAIHQAGIVHRDVKPQNVLIDRAGRAKLTDFGIARVVRDPGATETGTILGSAAYMAPEQALGKPVTPAADLYAAGIILYELLTGQLPFTSQSPVEVMYQHVHAQPLPPRRLNPTIPPAVEAVILRALAKAPEERYRSAEAMAAALEAAVQGRLRWPANGWVRTRRVRSRNRWRSFLLAGGVAFLVLVMLLAFAVAADSDRPSPTPTPVGTPRSPQAGVIPTVKPTAPQPTAIAQPTARPAPTATPTPLPPTPTPMPPSPTPTPPPPPTPTPAPPPSLAVPVPGIVPGIDTILPGRGLPGFKKIDVKPTQLGAYVPARDGALPGIPKSLQDAAFLFGAGSGQNSARLPLPSENVPRVLAIELTGLASQPGIPLQLVVNNQVVWQGTPLSNEKSDRVSWVLTFPAGSEGQAVAIELRNAAPGGRTGQPPWIAIESVTLYTPG